MTKRVTKAGLLGKQYESGDELAARLTELVQERARPLAAQAARADFDGKQASRLVQRVQVLESTDNTARAELAEAGSGAAPSWKPSGARRRRLTSWPSCTSRAGMPRSMSWPSCATVVRH